jgi:hypothetical protein
MSQPVASLTEIERVNEHVRKICGTPLIDLERIKRLTLMQKDPDAYDTSLPPLRAGVKEVWVDIFNGTQRDVLYAPGEEEAEKAAKAAAIVPSD